MPPTTRRTPAKAAGTATRTTPAKAVRDANFLPKRERKRIRKDLLNGRLNNMLADVRIGIENRAEFYRNLRMMKLRRIEIAKRMRALAIGVAGTQQQLRRIEDRNPDADLKLLDETLDLGRAAVAATEAAAAEWELFAKRKIYYSEVAA